MKRKKRIRFLVYTLSDPRNNQIRYVGQTTYTLTKRLNDHVRDCDYYKYKCPRWVAKLKKLGLRPIIDLIETVNNKQKLDEAEEFYISYFKYIGCDLLNHTKGGGGTVGRKASKEEILKNSRRQGGGSIQDQDGVIYLTIAEAARILNLQRSLIRKVLIKKNRHTKGYTFSYIGEPVPKKYEFNDEISIILSKKSGGLGPLIDNFGNEYGCIAIAARKLGLTSGKICKILQGRAKHGKGYTFAYKKDGIIPKLPLECKGIPRPIKDDLGNTYPSIVQAAKINNTWTSYIYLVLKNKKKSAAGRIFCYI